MPLYINNQASLTKLPGGIWNKYTGLTLRNYSGNVKFAGTLVSDKDVVIDGCPNITTLPAIKAGGHIHIFDCPNLTKPSGNLEAGGRIFIAGCPKLAKLPAKAVTKRSFSIYECPKVVALPRELEVGTMIELKNCTSLSTLPNHLEANAITVKNCPSITSLPRHTTAKTLSLIGCPGISKLPKEIRISEPIRLRDCANLTAPPKGIG